MVENRVGVGLWTFLLPVKIRKWVGAMSEPWFRVQSKIKLSVSVSLSDILLVQGRCAGCKIQHIFSFLCPFLVGGNYPTRLIVRVKGKRPYQI